MKLITMSVIVLIATASFATAGSIIAELCGPGHVNEVAMQSDVQANPGGYFVRVLNIQLRYGDPRIVNAVGEEFHLCTRSAATPDMSANMALLVVGERDVKYLFVPVWPPVTPSGM